DLGALEVGAPHALDQCLDVERVGAQDMVRDGVLEVAEQRLRVVDHAHLADAGQALIGPDLDDGEVPPLGSHDERGHLRDLQRSPSRSATPNGSSSNVPVPRLPDMWSCHRYSASSSRCARSAWFSSISSSPLPVPSSRTISSSKGSSSSSRPSPSHMWR